MKRPCLRWKSWKCCAGRWRPRWRGTTRISRGAYGHNMSAMFTVDQLIADCRKAIAAPSPDAAIKEIVARAVSSPREVEQALGTPTTAQIAPLYRAADLT